MRFYKAVLISDFNLSNFAALLANDTQLPRVLPSTAPFGQVAPLLLDGSAECWRESPDVVIVWTQPQGIFRQFNRLLCGEDFSAQELQDEFAEFAGALRQAAARTPMLFAPTWSIPSFLASDGLLSTKAGGVRYVLAQLNARLLELQQEIPALQVLDSQRWLESVGKDAFSPKLWYMAKVPFGAEVFREAVAEIKSAINGFTGNIRKLIIVDLDNTLWGGIVGDIGWENITLGGHDPNGEAFADFQRGLLLLERRGIILAIVSKNEEDIALEAIRSNPEMILKLEDFAGWRINWHDKAQNVADLVEELNLGLQSVVFLDDNPVERARVRETLPEVLVPELPEDKMLFRATLMGLRCFNIPAISQEDLGRTEMYRAERERSGLKATVSSVDEWLKSLQIQVKCEKLNNANLPRAAQLLNKTNQLNLSTRRLAEPELLQWAASDRHRLWTFRVTDKFGDSGLTGIASMEWEGDRARIVDLVLSCRVIGRRVEETMIYVLLDHCRKLGLRELSAEYLPTAKNAPCLHFLEAQSGLRRDGNTFFWDVSSAGSIPECVTLESTDAG